MVDKQLAQLLLEIKRNPTVAILQFLTQFKIDMQNAVDEALLREREHTTTIIKGIRGEQGDKGGKGDKGDKPIVGVDFSVPKDGKQGKKGDKGDKGTKPLVGVDFLAPKDGEDADPVKVADKLGIDDVFIKRTKGKDGSPDTGKSIIRK